MKLSFLPYINRYKESAFSVILLVLIFFFAKTSFRYQLADFDIFINAAEELSKKGNIYGKIATNKGFYYYYSVFFALLLLPFIKYHLLGKIVWTAISYWFYVRAFIIAKKFFPIAAMKADNAKYTLWLFLTLALTVKVLIENCFGAQLTPFLMWGMLECLNLVVFQRREYVAGALLGLLINIKLMPIVFLGIFIYRGYYKTVLACMATFVFLLYLPSLFIGHKYNMELVSHWLQSISPFNAQHNIETIDDGVRINLSALIPAYLMDGQTVFENLTIKRNIVNLNPQVVRTLITLSSLFVAVLCLYFLRSLPFKKAIGNLKTYWEAAYFMLIIPLIVPHQQQYALLLALPMIAYILYFFIYTWNGKQTIFYYLFFGIFVLAATVFSPINGLDVIGGKAFDWLKVMKIISFACIAIIPVAMYCTPERLKEILKNARTN